MRASHGPVWERDGIICTGGNCQDEVEIAFAQGAALDDPAGVFHPSLGAGTRRAIDLRDGDKHAVQELLVAAVAHDASGA